jgi:hypothetical protein
MKWFQQQHARGVLRQYDAYHYYSLFTIYVFIYYSIPTAAACMRCIAATQCQPLLLYSFICYFIIIHLLFSVSSGSMRKTSCSSMMPAMIILLFIHHLLIIYLLFSTCSGSMREASCSSMMPAIIIIYLFSVYSSIMQEESFGNVHCYYLFTIYYSFNYYVLPAAAACGRHLAAA